MQAGDSLTDISDYYQYDHGCMTTTAAASLVALAN